MRKILLVFLLTLFFIPFVNAQIINSNENFTITEIQCYGNFLVKVTEEIKANYNLNYCVEDECFNCKNENNLYTCICFPEKINRINFLSNTKELNSYDFKIEYSIGEYNSTDNITDNRTQIYLDSLKRTIEINNVVVRPKTIQEQITQEQQTNEYAGVVIILIVLFVLIFIVGIIIYVIRKINKQEEDDEDENVIEQNVKKMTDDELDKYVLSLRTK